MPVETREPYAGPVRAIDLERDTNTGRIYHLHRATVCPPCTGDCRQGRDCNAPDTIPTDWDSCAIEGGKHAEPAPTKTRREVTGARVGFVLLLVSATTVVGVISAAIVARWPMAWPLG